MITSKGGNFAAMRALTDYDEETAAAYEIARALDTRALAVWRDPVERHLNAARNQTVLDVGAGTGGFASALGGWLDAVFVAIEPAAAMRGHLPRPLRPD